MYIHKRALIMTTKFKPYKHEGCIIYSPKNREFLERFADALKDMTQAEKDRLDGRTVGIGGINYMVLLAQPSGHVVLTSKAQAKKTQGLVFLAET
jgi:hypothetical protein